MKIGDEVYIRGCVDEIRQDTVIIRNDGGYFGTVLSEVIEREPDCFKCKHYFHCCNVDEEHKHDCFEAECFIEDIKELPPKDIPKEPKRGKWIEIIDARKYGNPYIVGFYCSECDTTSIIERDFCPYCKADMRGDTE